jgi:hypothetical protein
MKFMILLPLLVSANLVAQVKPFYSHDDNGFTWEYYHIEKSLKKALANPLNESKGILNEIKRGETIKVASHFPSLYYGTDIDTVLENKVNWASRLISIEGVNEDDIYIGIGPKMSYSNEKQQCRMISFIYELPSDISGTAYKNEIRIMFLELGNNFDLKFENQFKIGTLIFNKAADKIKIDELRKVFR